MKNVQPCLNLTLVGHERATKDMLQSLLVTTLSVCMSAIDYRTGWRKGLYS